MKAIIITIGDEILSGTTVDTNSNFIAGQLKNIGIQVAKIITISDEVDTIKQNLANAFLEVDLIITTGGLGPTKDDKTKTALAEYFEDNLVLDPETFKHLGSLLEKRGRGHLLELNRPQAEVPSSAHIFQNHNGTAPGIMMRKYGKTAICLPGIPYEVKPLIKNQIIPFLKENFNSQYFKSRFVSVVNFPESQLSETLENWELALPENISLSYLPIANRVKLKLTARGKDEDTLNDQLDLEIGKVRPLLGDRIISETGDKIEDILHDILIKKNLTISVAESCTGGELSRLITSVPGSSAYYSGGITAYDYHKKIELLGVSEQTIAEKTPVSQEVAREMSAGCQKLFRTDITISTTGVAGPGTDTFDNQIGEVFYSVRIADFEQTTRLFLPHLERKDFMNYVSMKAIQSVIEVLVKP